MRLVINFGVKDKKDNELYFAGAGIDEESVNSLHAEDFSNLIDLAASSIKRRPEIESYVLCCKLGDRIYTDNSGKHVSDYTEDIVKNVICNLTNIALNTAANFRNE